MKTNILYLSLGMAAVLSAATVLADSRTATTDNPRSNPENSRAMMKQPSSNADVNNTARNVRDRGGKTVLPEDQSNKSAFLERTAAIRRDIMKDKNLSTEARNVKIITNDDGNVVLRGPVNSEEEKDKIESIAQRHRGDNAVYSYLEVQGKK